MPRENEEPQPIIDEAVGFTLPACVIALAMLLQLAGAVVPVIGSGWATFDEKHWPTELLPELKVNQYLRPTGTRIFNEFNYGGMLIQQTPGYRVFVDDRCELYGDKFLSDFTAIREMLHQNMYAHPGEPFAEWQAEYGSFDLALVESDGPFDVALSELSGAWDEVKRTKTATLYRKREP